MWERYHKVLILNGLYRVQKQEEFSELDLRAEIQVVRFHSHERECGFNAWEWGYRSDPGLVRPHDALKIFDEASESPTVPYDGLITFNRLFRCLTVLMV